MISLEIGIEADVLVRIRQIAHERSNTLVNTLGVLIREALANRECSESIRAVDGESAQEFRARLEAER